MKQKIHPLRNFLDKTYLGAAYLAAFFLVCILVIICVQMIARWTGFVVMGATAYAGYAMAASAFFAMAYTLHQDGHIRVRILLNKLGKNKKWGEEIVAFIYTNKNIIKDDLIKHCKDYLLEFKILFSKSDAYCFSSFL